MSSIQSSSKRITSYWLAWFFLANIGLWALLGLTYIPNFPDYHGLTLASDAGRVTATIFAVTAMIGQFTVVALLSFLLIWLLARLIAKCRGVQVVSIVLATVLTTLIVIDSLTYRLYQFHVGMLVWQIITTGAFSQVITLSMTEWLILIGIVVSSVVVELGLALVIRYWLRHCVYPKLLLVSLGICIGCLLLSFGLYAQAGIRKMSPNLLARGNAHLVLQEARVIPYYTPLANHLFFNNNKYRWHDLIAQRTLKYPIQPLHFSAVTHPLNILIIAIDTWRFDTLTPKTTPNIYRFAQRSTVFLNHFSGGNSTFPGIFSLFYSIPATYWPAIWRHRRSAILINALLHHHYQMGIFASASLNYPPFAQTLFSPIQNLTVETQGNNAQQRDQKITQEFTQFIHQRNHKRPFFSFLFYDAVHDYCESGTTYSTPFQPAIKSCDRAILTAESNPLPYLNRYKNALRYDDSLIGQVLSMLKRQHLLKNTVVIITADHGQEFNDEHLGYWGHGSAFDPYQIKVPLIIHWPYGQHKVISYKTSHYDIVPTLMKKVLQCTSPVSDYSIGVPLYVKGRRPFLLVSSYHSLAIIQNHRIVTLYPGGDYAITGLNEHPLLSATLKASSLKEPMQWLTRYYSTSNFRFLQGLGKK